jgi:hypothetical protein
VSIFCRLKSAVKSSIHAYQQQNVAPIHPDRYCGRLTLAPSVRFFPVAAGAFLAFGAFTAAGAAFFGGAFFLAGEPNRRKSV